MIRELSQALLNYQTAWQALVGERQDQAFFKALKPTAVAWKTVDIADFDRRFAILRDLCDQIHFGWIDERWLVTLHLRETAAQDAALPWNIRVIKLMQRRPGSKDAVGLDHVDFSSPNVNKAHLSAEPNLKWTEEASGDRCKWLSVWFAGTEAKLRTATVLQVCADEMLTCQAALLRRPA